jgi:fatty-acyl-CoA synthase
MSLLDPLRLLARRVELGIGVARSTGMLGALHPTRLAAFAADTWGEGRNPSLILRLHAFNTPDRLALVDGAQRFTYAALEERVARAVSGLHGLGVKPGARVALMMRNCNEYLVLQWALTRLGAIAVQVGYRLKPAEIAYIIGNATPSLFVCQPEDEATVRVALKEAGTLGEDRLLITGASLEAVIAGADPRVRPKVDKDAAGGLMVYTSGTTGRPKGAARDFKKQMHDAVLDFVRQIGIHHDDIHLCVCPLYHSAAPVFVAFTFVVGGTVVLERHFDPQKTLDLMARERITSTFMVPQMLARMCEVPSLKEGRPDLSSLRWLASGAAPLSTETARRIEEVFGKKLYNFYGATETGLVTLALPGEHTARPGTIGRVLAGNEIRLIGEDGKVGDTGEMFVKNSMLVAGYHKDEASTKGAMKDGFFSVGDVARVDGDGYYYLVDRKSDMVISGGVNIYPREIEERLHAHPAVLEAAVIGVPDKEWGEALRGFVVLRAGAEKPALDALRVFLAETLANYKVPKDIRFLDALPRNPTGKVLKRELAKL